MIDRYTLAEMGKLWSEEEKFGIWLEIEILACEVRSKHGEIPPEALKRIKEKARIDLKRIQEVEEEVRHDLIAFLNVVSEGVGDEARFIHLGLTSYDIEDTALAVRMCRALDLIEEALKKLEDALRKKATKYKDTVMMGRTHGVHAQPVTFGLKMALMYAETQRNRERMLQTRKFVGCGKLSGAVGTYSACPPFVEEYVCEKLGLEPAKVSTQILQRDRHAHYLATLAIVASSLDKFALEIRNLQRTEISEVEEPFRKGQKGSSAMPHKRNPIISERVCGLARIVRSNAQAGFENVALWHERDLTNSSVERVIIPDSSILVFYMLTKFSEVIEGLVVYPERMLENMELSQGLFFSQQILTSLVNKGLSRDESYNMVQRCAMRVHSEGIDFKDALMGDKEVRQYLSEEELESSFNLDSLLQNVGEIYKRVGIG
ncbi:Adenylosuccinate lyase [subsurface metagenome]